MIKDNEHDYLMLFAYVSWWYNDKSLLNWIKLNKNANDIVTKKNVYVSG